MASKARLARLERLAEEYEEPEEDTRPFYHVAISDTFIYDVDRVPLLHFHCPIESDVIGCPEISPGALETLTEGHQVVFHPLSAAGRQFLWEFTPEDEQAYLERRQQMANVKSGAIPADWNWAERFRALYAE